jgi:hypothetical protein
MITRPILFSGKMVRAILDGRKTQTRRIIKMQPHPLVQDGKAWDLEDCDGISGVKFNGKWHYCKQGEPGDQLWVRETWCVGKPYDHLKPSNLEDPHAPGFLAVDYAADEKRIWSSADQGKWRPSIFMPKWASRITLQIKRIRVERIRDIRPRDCESEGVSIGPLLPSQRDHAARCGFRHLWDSINAKRGFGCDVNPWVWVIEFRKIEP